MKYITLLFLITYCLPTTNAQECNFPLPPTTLCSNAPLLCDLDGYCSNNAGATNTGTPNAFCGIVENNEWVSFVAGSETFILEMTVSNCQNSSGLQAQVFYTEDCQNFTAVSNCIDPAVTSATLTATGLEIGQKYYLMIDGKQGDVCDYVLRLISGTTLSPAEIAIEPQDSLCQTQSTTLLAQNLSTLTGLDISYSWSTIDGNIVSGANTTNAQIDAAGNYQLIASEAGGCADTAAIHITEHPLPQIDIATPDTLNCVTQTTVTLQSTSDQANLSYIWTTDTGSFVSGENTATPTVDAPGVYEIEGTNPITGCQQTTDIEVYADQAYPIAQAHVNGELNCITPDITIDGSASSQGADFIYQWSTSDGSFLSGTTTLYPTVDRPGIYELLVTNTSNHCTANASVEVTLNEAEPSTADIKIKHPCYGEESGVIEVLDVIGGTAPYAYALNNDNFSSNSRFSPLEPASYMLTIEDATGCQWDTTLFVVEQDELILDLGLDSTICLGDSLQLQALTNLDISQIDTFIWSPKPPCNNCLEQFIQPLETTIYELTLVDVNECRVSDRVRILVDPNSKIFIPNVFSPNGDGDNDLFFINSNESVAEVLEFSVFNRWGSLLKKWTNFPANDPQYSWDGLFNNEPMPTGVYVYFAKIRLINGRTIVRNGDILLLK